MLLAGLEETALRLGLTVRYERLGDDQTEVKSGRCRLKGEEFILVDRRLSVTERVEVLSRELKKADLSGIYIKPFLRSLLEEPEDGP